MAKYHYNSKTNKIGHCYAIKCPLENGTAEHFNNYNEAVKFLEQVLEVSEGAFKPLSKQNEITVPTIHFERNELDSITFYHSAKPYVFVSLHGRYVSVHNSLGDLAKIGLHEINDDDIPAFINKYAAKFLLNDSARFIRIPDDNVINLDSLDQTYSTDVDKNIIVNDKKILSLDKRRSRKQWVYDLKEKYSDRRIFTSDGSYVIKDKKPYGAYGFMDLDGNSHVYDLSHNEIQDMQSNELEILSLLKISELQDKDKMAVVIDSDTAYDELSDEVDSPIRNQKLLNYESEIRRARQKVKDGVIVLELVKSHSGNLVNEAIDGLLKYYIRMPNKMNSEEKSVLADGWAQKKAVDWA